jgi:hypothetical protein
MSDWYEAEPPLHRVLIGELQRLQRRARARWPLLVVIALALTGAVVWKVARKPTLYRARQVLAITEGELVSGHDATPLHELREYVGNVLLSNAALLSLIEEKQLMRRTRARFGDEFAIESLRDQLRIGVWRNYFQYSYSFDERRTARIAIVFIDKDRDFAYEMARALTTLVINRESERRVEAAAALARQTEAVQEATRARLMAARSEQSAEVAALAMAEQRGDRGGIAIHRLRASELSGEVVRAQEAFYAIEQTTSAEALQAAVTTAGLALEIAVVEDRRPPRDDRSLLVLIGVGLVALILFLPLTSIVIGAFDTRVHDLEDVSRLGVVSLGHVPPFPGDHVGALRDRGVRRRRMPSWVPWR